MVDQKEFTQYFQKVTDEDISRLESVLEDNPKDLDVLDWLAFAMYSSGRYDRAVELYHRCIEIDPDSPSFHYFLGNCHYKLEDNETATAEWNRVMELDSDGKFRSRAREKLKLVV